MERPTLRQLRSNLLQFACLFTRFDWNSSQYSFCSGSLFGQYAIHDNNEISIYELNEIIRPVKFGKLKPKPKPDDVVETIVYHFDYKGDGKIDKEEFVHGIKKWVDEAVKIAKCLDKNESLKEFDRVRKLF